MPKQYEELTFTDDFMFCKILESHPDICEELVGLLMGKTVHIVRVNRQDPIEITADGRGIRLDVYAEDNKDKIYDIEMQKENRNDLPKRSRYYQGMIDLDQLQRGADFKDLKETFIIFICPFDPIGAGRYKYTFEARCIEDPKLKLDDYSYRVFINSKSAAKDASPEMKAFLDYLNGESPESGLTQKIDNAVVNAIKHEKWRQDYMTLMERDKLNREEGEKRLIKLIQKLYADNKENLVKEATDDAELRNELYQKYEIE